MPDVPVLKSERHRIDTQFNDLRVEIALGGIAHVAKDDKTPVTAIVYGSLFDVNDQNPARYLLDRYLDNRDGLWTRLNGSRVAMFMFTRNDGRLHDVDVVSQQFDPQGATVDLARA